MWFKSFVLLRLPVSAVCLGCLGMGIAPSSTDEEFSAIASYAALVYLVVVTVKLWRLRPGALSHTGWLLALELLGVALFQFTTRGVDRSCRAGYGGGRGGVDVAERGNSLLSASEVQGAGKSQACDPACYSIGLS